MRLFEFADGTIIDLAKVTRVTPVTASVPENQTYHVYFEGSETLTVWQERKFFGDSLVCQAKRGRLISSWQQYVGDIDE